MALRQGVPAMKRHESLKRQAEADLSGPQATEG